MKRLLITGISGLLGSNIAIIARDKFKVFGVFHKHPFRMANVESFRADLRKIEDLKKFESISPDLIIHCAALTNVDYCEEYPKEAQETNILMSILVTRKAKQIKARLIHISTDSVFDGVKGNYSEGDTAKPISVYGKTKLQAEQSVVSILPSACIVRTAIYGWNYQDKFSLAEWMIHKLAQGKKLKAFRDIQFSPILVNDLTEILFALERKKYAGIIHIGSRDAYSKFQFGTLIAKIFGFNSKLVEPISIEQLELKAPRGKDNSLNINLAETILNARLPTVEEGLRKYEKLQSRGFIEELRHG